MDEAVARRIVARERVARRAAEQLLEDKARELWDANQALARLTDSLEAKVAARTRELARVALEAREARRMAEAANDAKTRFLRCLSHEVRTPATAVVGYVEVLGDLLDDPERAREALVRLKAASEHLVGLTTEVLDLARIEEGGLVIALEDTTLAGVLEPVRATVLPKADARGHTLTVLYTDAPLRTDPVRLRQVVLNLTENAIKYTPPGGHVRVVVRGVDPVVIDVEDTGPGIPPDQLETVFEPFRQIGDTRGRKGLGLGLDIARRIAHALDGDLTATSTVGVGSRFTVTLGSSASAGRAPAAPAQTRRALHGVRVLVVDDAADTRHVFRWMLERAGARVIERTGGGAFGAEPVDAILLDLNLDGEDGLTVARRWSGRAPILLTTGDASAELPARAAAAGCVGVLTKPVRADRLIDAVACAVRMAGATGMATSAGAR